MPFSSRLISMGMRHDTVEEMLSPRLSRSLLLSDFSSLLFEFVPLPPFSGSSPFPWTPLPLGGEVGEGVIQEAVFGLTPSPNLSPKGERNMRG
jgi:hypothetical protein